MKKYLSIAFLSIILISSCEKDDFCTQNPVTPKLVIKFRNYNDVTKIKRPDSLYVWAKEKDSLFSNISVDSVFLPLNTLSNKTVYNLSVSKDSISNLTIQYKTEEEYISRSCGFRVFFNDIVISENTLSKSWIDSISTKNVSTINNQNNAHITIFH